MTKAAGTAGRGKTTAASNRGSFASYTHANRPSGCNCRASGGYSVHSGGCPVLGRGSLAAKIWSLSSPVDLTRQYP